MAKAGPSPGARCRTATDAPPAPATASYPFLLIVIVIAISPPRTCVPYIPFLFLPVTSNDSLYFQIIATSSTSAPSAFSARASFRPCPKILKIASNSCYLLTFVARCHCPSRKTSLTPLPRPSLAKPGALPHIVPRLVAMRRTATDARPAPALFPTFSTLISTLRQSGRGTQPVAPTPLATN